MPIEMPASVVPVTESRDPMQIVDQFSHITMKDPPSGVQAEAGICWLDTVSYRSCALAFIPLSQFVTSSSYRLSSLDAALLSALAACCLCGF